MEDISLKPKQKKQRQGRTEKVSLWVPEKQHSISFNCLETNNISMLPEECGGHHATCEDDAMAEDLGTGSTAEWRQSRKDGSS
jgi:hypothetical protein